MLNSMYVHFLVIHAGTLVLESSTPPATLSLPSLRLPPAQVGGNYLGEKTTGKTWLGHPDVTQMG